MSTSRSTRKLDRGRRYVCVVFLIIVCKCNSSHLQRTINSDAVMTKVLVVAIWAKHSCTLRGCTSNKRVQGFSKHAYGCIMYFW